MTVYRERIHSSLISSYLAFGAAGRRAASAGHGKLLTSTSRSYAGQTLVEYGLLIALIAVVAIVALLFLGPIVSGLFNNIGNTIQQKP